MNLQLLPERGKKLIIYTLLTTVVVRVGSGLPSPWRGDWFTKKATDGPCIEWLRYDHTPDPSDIAFRVIILSGKCGHHVVPINDPALPGDQIVVLCLLIICIQDIVRKSSTIYGQLIGAIVCVQGLHRAGVASLRAFSKYSLEWGFGLVLRQITARVLRFFKNRSSQMYLFFSTAPSAASQSSRMGQQSVVWKLQYAGHSAEPACPFLLLCGNVLTLEYWTGRLEWWCRGFGD